MKYNHLKIESKWQDIWENEKTFKSEIDPDKEKCYILDMFPYPSGAGLHVGHPLGYTATDIYSRFKRLNNFNVLHPIGWDAFGLPAEQYAIKTGTHPKITTEENIKNFKRQIKMLGFSYDWDREINTTDEKYYKWTQWIFLQLYKKGLAYEAKVPVNWCPELKAVLANEEVVDGKSEIGGHPVIRKPMRQWMFKITEYAESLLEGLDDLDWPESVKELQKNWIGKSIGAKVTFKLPSIKNEIEVFTTRPDTLFGATYVVLAPEHPFASKLILPEKEELLNNYILQSQKKSDLDRGELNKDKTGFFTGSYAINPINNKKIQIWIADYVLMSYGTGAIMAVPGHDKRDYEFAGKFNIPILEVVSGGDLSIEAFTGNDKSKLINSSNEHIELNGLDVKEAKKVVIKWLEKSGNGLKSVQYKLRDWLFSRQRYWGEPIPVVHQNDGSITALNESELPLILPEVDKYEPASTGESPLANIAEWLKTENGRRETNTMPQWAGSCWYYLRYIDPLNEKEPWSKEKEDYWMPVDLYVGGAEHAVLHLLYSRFWHHVLFDLGLVSTKEPFQKLYNQGMIRGEDGQKMSKSRGNVVNPDIVVKEYGADSFRLYEMFMGPLDKSKPWNTKGLQGCFRFISKVWRICTENTEKIIEGGVTKETQKLLHQTIKKVTDDLNKLRFNTVVSHLMIFTNHLQSLDSIDKSTVRTFLQLMNPLAPHISEEINEMLGYSRITSSEWPSYNNKLIEEEKIVIAVQFNGKTRGTLSIDSNYTEDQILSTINSDQKLSKYFDGFALVKTILIPKRLINFVLKPE